MGIQSQGALHRGSGREGGSPTTLQMVRTADIRELHGIVEDVLSPYRVTYGGGHCSADIQVDYATLGSLGFCNIKYSNGNPLEVRPGLTDDYFVILFQTEGMIEVEYGRESVAVTPGMAAIISPHIRSRLMCSQNASSLLLRIDRSLVENCLSAYLDRSLPHPVEFALAMDFRDRGGAALWRNVQYLRNEISMGSGALTTPLTVRSIEQLMVTALLEHHGHNYSPALMNMPSSTAAPRHVRIAEEFIHANAAEPVDVETLAGMAGVSSRTLFEGFRRFRDTTPIKYLRKVRLEKARQELLQGGPGKTITEISNTWGFSQPGRFAIEYKKLFGESPSETMRRFR